MERGRERGRERGKNSQNVVSVCIVGAVCRKCWDFSSAVVFCHLFAFGTTSESPLTPASQRLSDEAIETCVEYRPFSRLAHFIFIVYIMSQIS